VTTRPSTAHAPVARAADAPGNAPVLVLSYSYSGADRVQSHLAAGTDLVCTSGTGVVPLCVAAAETWRRVECRPGPAMSRLAASTIRGLVSAQITVVLSGAGGRRWCELVTAPAGAADTFLQVFPGTVVVCVHRSCADVLRAGVKANPWGLSNQGLLPYLLPNPGNIAAALAAYWANATEQLLAFEAAHPGTAHRVRFEDVRAAPERALAGARVALRLDGPACGVTFPEPVEPRPIAGIEPPVPLEMIPEPLRARIGHLQAALGYAPPEDWLG
jgi:sulfotransferase family protein